MQFDENNLKFKLHVNKHWFWLDAQVPPDKHGFGEQKLIVVEHCVPVYPHGQTQINELAFKIWIH
jgi:hypothetical protein